MSITNDKLIELTMQKVSGRTEEAFEQLQRNFGSSESFFESIGPSLQQIVRKIGLKQQQAVQEIAQKVQRQQELAAPNAAFQYCGKTIAQVLEQTTRDLQEKWETGLIKAEQEKGAVIIYVDQNESKKNQQDPLVSQSTQPKKKLKILNPTMLFQQYAIDQIFSYENLARDVLHQTKEKDPISHGKLEKPKTPRKPLKRKQESEVDPQKMKQKKERTQKKNKILNPQMLFQQYAMDKIFSFQNLARDILEETVSKKPHKGSQIKKMAPRKAPGKKQEKDLSEVDKQVQQKKQFKTRTNKVKPLRQEKPTGKSMETNSKFNQYKKQLASLEDRQQPSKQVNDGRRRVQSESKRALQFSSPASQGKARVYRIAEDSIRKHSLKKSKQAENQMMANIQFLRSMRGSSNGSTSKKQWKQDTSQVRKTIQEIREGKRKHLQSLGFTDPASRLLQSKLGQSEVYSPQRSDILPEIRKSRKRGQVYKPAAFSVYTIQKDNEIFYNKFVK